MNPINSSELDETQKEATAINVMSYMLTQFADDHQISYEEALDQFTRSRTYISLFDYKTDIWKEGPDYLRGLYEEERTANKKYISWR